MTTELKELQEKIAYDKTFDCVQCGYCLPACPTYKTMEKETHSPRGRINLVKMVAEGKASIEDMKEPIEKCLGCMACTTVCPTHVQYGEIFESAKEVLEDHEQKSGMRKKTENFLFGSFFPSRRWMKTLGNATWVYQASGMQKVAQTLRLTSVAPLNLDQFERALPKMPTPAERRRRETRVEPDGAKQTTVAFFKGCVMDSVFFETNRRSIELLRLAGAEVVTPVEQTCCGALHAHDGKKSDAKELAKRNIEIFENEDVDHIVNNAGGCGAKLVEYGKLLADEPEWAARAEYFSEKVKDISEVLAELDGLTFTKPVRKKATYQPSCHMTNVQRVTAPPRTLLAQIPELKLAEMTNPDFCCGSAGIYNILNYEDAMDILDVKMEDVADVEPEVIVTTNPGCLLQMKLGIEREGTGDMMEAVHLVDLLMEAGPRARF
ncbi:(Fe-S)-binding protein [Natribacillus halophilus]|uniref:Glycolate oxidase iron-sulfur subunit n=1 Tax=Natribacillus halophilus TaxID=549003 RepID=A0A1G8KSA3_9BACI|nr:(Fe-S)-binding protein [Natribacillus halophilus]SDI45780.1 glycolate oxidase iron-sulfur subunit [Natribacillus halophilus]